MWNGPYETEDMAMSNLDVTQLADGLIHLHAMIIMSSPKATVADFSLVFIETIPPSQTAGAIAKSGDKYANDFPALPTRSAQEALTFQLDEISRSGVSLSKPTNTITSHTHTRTQTHTHTCTHTSKEFLFLCDTKHIGVTRLEERSRSEPWGLPN